MALKVKPLMTETSRKIRNNDKIFCFRQVPDVDSCKRENRTAGCSKKELCLDNIGYGESMNHSDLDSCRHDATKRSNSSWIEHQDLRPFFLFHWSLFPSVPFPFTTLSGKVNTTSPVKSQWWASHEEHERGWNSVIDSKKEQNWRTMC